VDDVLKLHLSNERSALLQVVGLKVGGRISKDDKTASLTPFGPQLIEHDASSTDELDIALSRQDAAVTPKNDNVASESQLLPQDRCRGSGVEFGNVEPGSNCKNFFWTMSELSLSRARHAHNAPDIRAPRQQPVGGAESRAYSRIQDVPDHRAICQCGDDSAYQIRGRPIAKHEVVPFPADKAYQANDSLHAARDISESANALQMKGCRKVLPLDRPRERLEDVLNEVWFKEKAFTNSVLKQALAHDAGARKQDCSPDPLRVEKFQDIKNRPAGAPVPRRIVDEERIQGSLAGTPGRRSPARYGVNHG
jgi:hypothetical protein